MKEGIVNRNELEKAYDIAYYYRYPERISDYDKAILNKAKANNPALHFKALAINRTKYWENKKTNEVR